MFDSAVKRLSFEDTRYPNKNVQFTIVNNSFNYDNMEPTCTLRPII